LVNTRIRIEAEKNNSSSTNFTPNSQLSRELSGRVFCLKIVYFLQSLEVKSPGQNIVL